MSCSAFGAAPGAGAGSSDLPPNRPLKRSVSDCADAGCARPQPSPATTVAASATLNNLMSPMRRPCHLRHLEVMFPEHRIRTDALDSCFDAFSLREPASTSLENALPGLIAGQWRR